MKRKLITIRKKKHKVKIRKRKEQDHACLEEKNLNYAKWLRNLRKCSALVKVMRIIIMK